MPYADLEKRKAHVRKWRFEHLERCSWYKTQNPEKTRDCRKRTDLKRRDSRRIYTKQYRQDNREYLRRAKREYYLANKNRIAIRDREYRRKNKDRIRLRRGKKHNLACSISTRLRFCLRKKNIPKTCSTLTLLGCSLPNFRIYIESKFEPGMTWENWGRGNDKWHLDHIVPIAIFDFSRISHQKRCFHFSNYQPLWQPDNFLKGSKPPKSHQFEML